jgi:hypothetical protein
MVDSFNQVKKELPNVDTDHIIIVSPYPTVYKRSRGLTLAHEVMFSPLQHGLDKTFHCLTYLIYFQPTPPSHMFPTRLDYV